jgi:hypothetical protein
MQSCQILNTLWTHCVCKTEVSFGVPMLLAIFSNNATFFCKSGMFDVENCAIKT